MSKHHRKKTASRTSGAAPAPRSGKIVVRDWAPLLTAVQDVIDWALDIGVALSHARPDDIEAIENVRHAFHAWLDGKPCDMELNDLLLTFGTILAAIELDLGIDSAELLAPIHEMRRSPRTFAPVLHFPGVERAHRKTVVIRRCPGARTARSPHSPA